MPWRMCRPTSSDADHVEATHSGCGRLRSRCGRDRAPVALADLVERAELELLHVDSMKDQTISPDAIIVRRGQALAARVAGPLLLLVATAAPPGSPIHIVMAL